MSKQVSRDKSEVLDFRVRVDEIGNISLGSTVSDTALASAGLFDAGLRGSIGERSNHSNLSKICKKSANFAEFLGSERCKGVQIL